MDAAWYWTHAEGASSVVLENQKLRVTVLLDKGTDIWEFLYKPLESTYGRSPMLLRDQGVRALFQHSLGLWYDTDEGAGRISRPAAGPPPLRGRSSAFTERPAPSRGSARVGGHAGARVRCSRTGLYRSPFYIEKKLTLVEHSRFSHRRIRGERSQEEMELMWGHHPALGGNFLGRSWPSTPTQTRAGASRPVV